MNIRMATQDDIDILIHFRMEFLRGEWADKTHPDESGMRAQMEQYFPAHVGVDLIAVLAEEEAFPVSTAYLVVTERPAGTHFPSGRTGMLLNVFTRPNYRNKGYASAVLKQMLLEAKRLGLDMLELSATEAAKPLYEQLGFEMSPYDSMRLKLT